MSRARNVVRRTLTELRDAARLERELALTREAVAPDAADAARADAALAADTALLYDRLLEQLDRL